MTDTRESVTRTGGKPAADEQRRAMTTQERICLKRIGDALARARLERRMTAPPLLRLFDLATLYGVPPESLIAGGGGQARDTARDISSLLTNLPPHDREFIRQWVSAMCVHLANK
jgi:hypothetical protein